MQQEKKPPAGSDGNPALMPRRRHLGEKALHLRIVEEFLTQLELHLLKSPSEQFNLDPVKQCLSELKTLSDDPTESDRRKRVEFQLAHELLLWQDHLAKRDERIEAYHIRRYCDGLRKPLDSEVYVALARFYREIPRSRHSLSKFDLAITRAYSVQLTDIRRQLVSPRKAIAESISAHYCSWDRVAVTSQGSHRDEVVFDAFLNECNTVADFHSLTASRLFDRIREYKSELADRFWDPIVVAAAIECNVLVGNKLNFLMAKASETLGERLGSEFDFAGAFQDASPNAGNHISEVIRAIDKKDSLITSVSESDDLKFLRSLLALTDTVRDAAETTNAEAGEEPEAAFALSISTTEFQSILSLLSQHNPSTRSIVRFIDSLQIGHSLDLSDFLFGEDDLPDPLGREALATILSLESLRSVELHEPKELPAIVRDQVMELLRTAENLGNRIERSLSEANVSAGRRLIVANRLLEARMRTERAVYKFTSRGLGIAKEKEPDETAIEPMPSTFSYVDYASLSANKWLVGATVAALLLSGFLYLSAGRGTASLPDDVEIIEASRLPGGKVLSNAHRQGSTLYVVATDAWRQKSDSEKTESLKDLIGIPSKTRLETVLVLDDQGQPLADISGNGMNLNTVAPVYSEEGNN